jgi:putative acetyltransferase
MMPTLAWPPLTGAPIRHQYTQDDTMIIRQGIAADYPQLLDIWLRAVRATHHFLQPSDIDALLPQLRDVYFPAVDLWVAEDTDDQPLGFIGFNENHVEMLFVDPARHRQGIGRALLDFGRQSRSAMSVDVNEQNPQATAFYQHYGFVQTGRSPLDGEGRPFPLLHMNLPTRA